MSSRTHCENHLGERKRVFESRQAAKQVASSAKWLTPYQCPDCTKWHITSKRRAKPKWEK